MGMENQSRAETLVTITNNKARHGLWAPILLNDNLFVGLVGFLETGFLCVRALAFLEIALVDQAGLEFTEICLSLPHKCWD